MKKTLFKGVVLTVVFIGAFFYFSDNSVREERAAISEMTTSNFPLVYIENETINYNDLHGYKQPMQVLTMKEPVTVTDLEAPIEWRIKKNSNKILSVGYELYDKGQLIETNELHGSSQEDGQELHFSHQFQSMIFGETYQLVLMVTTEERGTLYYYITIVADAYNMEEALKTLQAFHFDTFEKTPSSRIEELVSKRNTEGEPLSLDNVDLNSSIEAIMWGDLDVVQMAEPMPRLTAIDQEGQVGSFDVPYVIATRHESELSYYQVLETYEIIKEEEGYSIAAFSRTANHLVDKKMLDVEENLVDFGILSNKETIEIVSSQNKRFMVFVQGKQLWLLDQNNNQMINVFSFDQLNSDYLMDTYGGHEIQVVEVLDSGNIKYVVKGYMNTGPYEGYNGLLFNAYDHSQQLNNTLTFIPMNDNYQELPYLTSFQYINEAGEWFIIYKDTLYRLDFKSNSYEVIATNLPVDQLNVYRSSDKSVLAWQESANDKKNQVVHMVNLETKEKYALEVSEEERVKILGFMSRNLVIGYAHVDNILETLEGNITFPMSQLTIYNENHEIEKIYEPDGNNYIGTYTFEENRLNLNFIQVIKSSSSQPLNNKISFEASGDDFIVYMSQTVETDYALETKIIQEGYMTHTLHLPLSLADQRVEYTLAKQAITQVAPRMILAFDTLDERRYKVYGTHTNTMVYYTDRLATAIEWAKEKDGQVYDEFHRMVWTKEPLVVSYTIPGVPIISQRPELPRGCEVTSLAMILNYYGMQVDKMTLAEEIIKDPVPYTTKNNMIYYGDLHEGFIGDMYSASEPGIGVYHEPVEALMAEYVDEKDILDLTGTQLEDLLYYIDKKIPVWINVANNYNEVPESLIRQWLTPNGVMEISYTEHAVVITGYDKNYIYYNNPSNGTRDKTSIENFEKAYNQYGKQALVYFK